MYKPSGQLNRYSYRDKPAMEFVDELLRLPWTVLRVLYALPIAAVIYSVLLGSGLGSATISLFIRYFPDVQFNPILASITFIVVAVVPLQCMKAMDNSDTVEKQYTALWANVGSVLNECVRRSKTSVLPAAVWSELDGLQTALLARQTVTWHGSLTFSRLVADVAGEAGLSNVAALLGSIDERYTDFYRARTVPFPAELRSLAKILMVLYNGVLFPCVMFSVMGWACVPFNAFCALWMVALVRAGIDAWDPFTNARTKHRLVAIYTGILLKYK